MKISRRKALKASLLTGLGMLVTGRSIAQSCLTTSDIEGPYYISGSPLTTKLSPSGASGTPLFMTGSVYAKDCQTPLKNAVVDVWHADDAGNYENDHYRGIIKTDASGKYAYETILPGKYLNVSTHRPRHLHYKVSAPDIDSGLVLTTQIYFEGDTSIPGDPWASDPKADDRIIPLSTDQNNAEHGVADIVLDVVASTGMDRHSSPNGSTIQSVYPNPVVDDSRINILLSQPGRVSIKIFDLQGRVVSRFLEDKMLNAGLHQLPFSGLNKNGLKLSPGIYIVKLWMDNKPADVKRFLMA